MSELGSLEVTAAPPLIAAPWDTLSHGRQPGCTVFLTQKHEIIKVCCFKLLHSGIICYAATAD